jgi:AraC-like DNA-binding protein
MSLNKPAIGREGGGAVSDSVRWYLWDGGFLAVGRVDVVVPPHAHHAIQIVIALDGEVLIRGKRGDWRPTRGLVVRPDVTHSYDQRGALGAMLFIDPESAEGVWLRSVLKDDITLVPETRVSACAGELRRFIDDPFESLEISALIKRCVQAFSPGVPPSRRIDDRITRVLAAIRSADDLRMSIDDAAGMVFLSPSRFAHLFKQQVGLPFRRYILWRKLTRSILVIGRERTIATAAHAADFADAAHLTRTFYQMFGLPPSVMLRGEFFEIPSPFEVASPSQQ